MADIQGGFPSTTTREATVIESYIRSGHSAIVVNTLEENRALQELRTITEKLKMNMAIWSVTQGVQINGRRTKCTEAIDALMAGGTLPEDTVYCLLDIHPFLHNPHIWRTAKDAFFSQRARGIVFVFLSAHLQLPPELEREMVVTDLPLPTREELEGMITAIATKAEFTPPDDLSIMADAALGLTVTEAENAFALSLVGGGFDASAIAREKEQIVRKSGVLEIYSPDTNMDAVGGLTNLKDFLRGRVEAYSPEAQRYGLPSPRGVLLVGVPGCGKSLSAKALAAQWQKPLLKLDVGRLFGGLVGESEANTRRALKTAEAVAPAVLWLDEIEKGMSGIQSSGRSDGGVTARVFGQFLTWLQEKKAPVFVMATANSVEHLPPEFLRKGRFDEVFFIDLPSAADRVEIFRVQLKRHKRAELSTRLEVLEELAAVTEGYTGAEIEESVVAAMFTAWNDGRRAVSVDDIKAAARVIVPLSTSMADRIGALRTWAKTGARLANGTASSFDPKKPLILAAAGPCPTCGFNASAPIVSRPRVDGRSAANHR